MALVAAGSRFLTASPKVPPDTGQVQRTKYSSLAAYAKVIFRRLVGWI
jgi:hypothetical protein